MLLRLERTWNNLIWHGDVRHWDLSASQIFAKLMLQYHMFLYLCLLIPWHSRKPTLYSQITVSRVFGGIYFQFRIIDPAGCESFNWKSDYSNRVARHYHFRKPFYSAVRVVLVTGTRPVPGEAMWRFAAKDGDTWKMLSTGQPVIPVFCQHIPSHGRSLYFQCFCYKLYFQVFSSKSLSSFFISKS